MAINLDDVQRQLEAAGLLVKLPLEVGTAKPVRCRVDGGGTERRGWYRLYEMTLTRGDVMIVGAFGIYSGNDNGAQKIQLPKLGRERMSPDQVEAFRARMKAEALAAAAELKRQHERAAARATRWWGQLSREAGANAYLARKGLPTGKLYGARLSAQGNLVVPISDARGKVWGLQVIYSDPAIKAKKGRDKDYSPPGLKKQGHWFLIGLAGRGSVILLCEGFATGASLHEATGLPVAVAFDAGNLLHVAKGLAAAYKGARILVCADDDWLQKCHACNKLTPVDASPICAHCGQEHGRDNPGASAAEAAALAIGGAWVRPEFPTQRPADRKGDTDFNDLHCHPQGGLHLVARQVEAVLQAQGWKVATRAPGAPSAPGGEGEGRRRAVSVLPLDDLVERYVPLDDGSGDYLFDRWTNRIVKVKQAVALLPAGVRWDDVKRHPTWIERGAYYLDQVGFDPDGSDRGVELNTWQGWPMKPKPGSCERLLDLLRYLCGEDNGDEVYWWLLRWMAYPLQNPGAKMNSAVIMHGPQGTGKSTVFQALAKIYGDYSTVLNQRGLEDKFNADWSDSKLFILAEEVVTRQEMWHIKNELKELVTGEWIRINPKNVAAYRQRNHLNIAYLSNEGQPLPIENDDRRHLVVWTPPEREEAYYDRVQLELAAGGIEAFYAYLLALDLEGFHPKKRPPMTEAKRELIQVSKTSEQRFIDEWADHDLPLPVGPCVTHDLYTAYSRWCRANGEKHPRASNQFLNLVGRVPGWEKRKARVAVPGHQGGKLLPVVIPSPKLLEAEGSAMPPASKPPVWLNEWCTKFADAVREYGKDAAWNA
jgi:putative DNA primase/helicase